MVLTHLQHRIFPASILQGTGAESQATVTWRWSFVSNRDLESKAGFKFLCSQGWH